MISTHPQIALAVLNRFEFWDSNASVDTAFHRHDWRKSLPSVLCGKQNQPENQNAHGLLGGGTASSKVVSAAFFRLFAMAYPRRRTRPRRPVIRQPVVRAWQY